MCLLYCLSKILKNFILKIVSLANTYKILYTFGTMKSVFPLFSSKSHTPRKGFTLLEIIIVVVILGVVAGLGLNSYSKIIREARINAAKMNLAQIYAALEIYHFKNKTYVLSGVTLAEMNSDLNLNIIDPNMNYFITWSPPPPSGTDYYTLFFIGPGASCWVDSRDPKIGLDEMLCTIT